MLSEPLYTVRSVLGGKAYLLSSQAISPKLSLMRDLAQKIIFDFFEGKYILEHLPNGAPILVGKKPCYSISISHSSVELRILVSKEFQVSIDIEKKASKALSVAKKFLNEKELLALNYSANQSLMAVMLWTFKELAYKFYSMPDFKHSFSLIQLGDKSLEDLIGSLYYPSEYLTAEVLCSMPNGLKHRINICVEETQDYICSYSIHKK